MPLVVLHDAGWEQFGAGEEGRDLRVGAQRRRGGDALVVAVGHGGDLVPRDVARGVSDGQPAAGGQPADKLRDDPGRVVGVGDQVEDADQHDGDRLAEIQQPGGGAQHVFGISDISVEVSARPFRGAGEERPRVREDHRVVVDVDDPALRSHGLGDLVCVFRHRQPGAEVKELTDTAVRDQVAHRRGEERALRSYSAHDVGVGRLRLLADLAIGLEVVLPAQPVVVDPGRVRDRRVIRERFLGDVTRVGDEFVSHTDILDHSPVSW